MECGHRFKTVAAAMRAANGDAGCPKCGGSDIDTPTAKETEAFAAKVKAFALERKRAAEAMPYKAPAGHPYAAWLNTKATP
jgi:predicted  nucleic acid-binding Zn-ribbon protein